MKAKKVLSYLIIPFLGVAAFLVILEITFRVLGFPCKIMEWMPYKDTGFSVMKPNHDYIEKWFSHQRPHRVKINSLGFRDNEFFYPDGYKIFVIGDSFAYGSGVELSETFVDRVEKRLRESEVFTKGAEVVNCGTGGAGIYYETFLLKEKVLPLKPSMVILQFYQNDIEDALNYKLLMKVYKQVGFPLKRYLRKTAVYIQLLKLKLYVVSLKVGKEINEAQNVASGAWEPSSGRVEPPDQIKEGLRIYFENLREFVRICRREKIDFSLLMVPSKNFVEQKSKQKWLSDKFYDFAVNNQSIITITIKEMITPFRFGNIFYKGEFVTGLEEKHDFKTNILAGIYIMKPEIFNHIPYNEYYGMDALLMSLLADNIPISKYDIHEYWLDIGIESDYKEAQTIYNKLYDK